MVVAVPPPPALIRVLRRFTLCLLRRHDWAHYDGGAMECFCCQAYLPARGELLDLLTFLDAAELWRIVDFKELHRIAGEVRIITGIYWPDRIERIEGKRESSVREAMHEILEQRRARRNREAFFARH